MNNILLLVLIASVGPFIGSLIGVTRKPTYKLMVWMIAFAAGVMISVSFLELVPEGMAYAAHGVVALGLLAGPLLIMLAEKIIPHVHPELADCEDSRSHAKRTATLLVIGIFLHNFPEGMAIGLGAVADMKLSFLIALAIAIHDIPEAICTSAPYYYTFGRRLKAFLISVSTVLPTLAGFLLTYFIFRQMPESLIGFFLAATAGIMVYISTHELIPMSFAREEHHRAAAMSMILGCFSVIILNFL